MSKGKRITKGWEAEIYEWLDSTTPKVLKLFYSYPESRVQIERDITLAIYEARGPAPAVFSDVIRVDGRFGFIMEYISGPDMDSQISSHPFNKNLIDMLGRQLGKLHATIHCERCINLQRNLKDITASSIKRANAITEKEKNLVLQSLDKLPDGDRVCHLDFHPGNVIYDNKNKVVIDWGNAAIGDPAADVARSQLLITTSWIGSSLLEILLSGFLYRFKANIRRSYTEGYFLESTVNFTDVDRWRTVIAAARLGEKLPRIQQKYIAKRVREGFSSL